MEITSQQILNVPIHDMDSGAKTIREYIIKLASEVWERGEGFSGKRPFGNNGWQFDVYAALIKAGFVEGTFDENGFIEDISRDEIRRADRLIADAIKSLA